MNLDELIERLEKATGPDRELRDDVLLACGWRYVETAMRKTPRMIAPDGAVYAYADTPDPMFSIDAASNLVPPNCTRASGNLNEHDMYWACVTPHAEPCPDYGGESPVNEAIAVCIAAIKCRRDNP